jgi:carbamoylphosphate synthase large subunit
MIQSKVVLIGSSGAGNAFASSLALRRNWGNSIRLIATDTNPRYLVSTSLVSDKFYQVPDANNPEFKNIVAGIMVEEEVNTYVPFVENEIVTAALLYESGKLNKEFYLQVKDAKIANLCNDKYKTFLWLSENNILTPTCFEEIPTNHDLDKLILKPRKGFGSKVCKLSEISGDISHYNMEEYIIQQECEKPEITIDVCYDKGRNFFNYVCRERIETKCGVCTKARLFYDEQLEKTAFTIAEKMNLVSYCFQVMKYKGEWAVTDINPRLGAGTPMSFAAGMDFFSGMFAILWGEDPTAFFRSLKKETYVVRQYCDFNMSV